MNIVIDTNVIISGIFFGGYPRKILETVADKQISAYATTEIINEYYEIIDEMIKRKQGRINNSVLSQLVSKLKIIQSSSSINICRDPDDNKFIECAIDANALYIISGDKDLLDIQKFNNKSMQIFLVARKKIPGLAKIMLNRKSNYFE